MVQVHVGGGCGRAMRSLLVVTMVVLLIQCHLECKAKQDRSSAQSSSGFRVSTRLLHRPSDGRSAVIRDPDAQKVKPVDRGPKIESLSKDPQCKLSKIGHVKANIANLLVDVVVNAANSKLAGGGGVDHAIHEAAGRTQLLEYNKRVNGHCDTGNVVSSPGFKLPAPFIFHTVGPIGENPELLASCYRQSLDLLKKKGLRSIAFPCISAGVYGYPQREAAKVALQTVNEWLNKPENYSAVDKITFCTFTEEDTAIYGELIPKMIRSRQLSHSSVVELV